uniref:Uncharacterized protein n=1 Tax=Knipowitschia caucasica TaxID=637954 RepID=A0AAV2JZP3_KNICA
MVGSSSPRVQVMVGSSSRGFRLSMSMDDVYEERVTANSLLERLSQEEETWQSKGTAERWMEVLQTADLPNIQAAVSFVLSIPSSTGRMV